LVRPEESQLTPPNPVRSDLLEIFHSALDACSAPRLIARALAHSPGDAATPAASLAGRLGARDYRLIAVGKASPFMANAFVHLVGRSPVSGLVVGTHCEASLAPGLEWIEGSHPVPDARSETAGRRALEVAGSTGASEVLVVLVSGGASALLVQPRRGITLADKQAATRQLLLGGADIHALNTVRKHLSAIKGGQLAAAAAGTVVALAISDVVGDDLSVIGSGPTVPDPTTFDDALAVIGAHGGASRFPTAVVELLTRGSRGGAEDTPKPGDRRLAQAETRVIGSRHDAVRGAAARAAELGYEVAVLPDPVIGEARDAGRRLARLLRNQRRGTCLIAAGETTVTVKGAGRGGRNQELVLAAAQELSRSPVPAGILSGGTDGIDGPTDAAGAVADHETMDRAARVALGDGSAHLANNDAYAFFARLADLVTTGPTNTNVGDVQVLIQP
jgi:hydroxypyruvate reductase